MNVVLILASGMGSRMKAQKNKIFLELEKKPLIFHTISNFEVSKDIDEIIIVSKEDEIYSIREILDKYNFKKVTDVIVGSDTRQGSAYNGVNFIYEKYKDKQDLIVLFHNGANPFVNSLEIEKVIKGAMKSGAAAVGHKTKDTIRKVDKDNFSKGIIDRSKLWNMQTPQAVKLSLAKKSFDYASDKCFEGTDDCSVVENYGGNVKIVEASDNNFKITTPIDLELARVILNNLN